MSDPIFDLDSWEPMFPLSDDVAVDRKGAFSMRLGDNVVMDMETGETHFTTTWETQKGDSDDGS